MNGKGDSRTSSTVGYDGAASHSDKLLGSGVARPVRTGGFRGLGQDVGLSGTASLAVSHVRDLFDLLS